MYDLDPPTFSAVLSRHPLSAIGIFLLLVVCVWLIQVGWRTWKRKGEIEPPLILLWGVFVAFLILGIGDLNYDLNGNAMSAHPRATATVIRELATSHCRRPARALASALSRHQGYLSPQGADELRAALDRCRLGKATRMLVRSAE